ncbi:MAG: glycoside hydrolase family 88 protein [Cyclobacteriaceae bacterium]|nr:glycoside hydrolase family 88 protein [Cyclobacteriaceae bacterium]UYN85776.1 MAG: glycoside hydrolase family 88 protein [Cyclobacteriaceae bacterium]
MYRLLFLALVLLMACNKQASDIDSILITVERNYEVPKKSEQVVIFIDWKELIKRAPGVQHTTPVVTDRNFGTEVPVGLIDTDDDKSPDFLILEYTLNSNEPVFTFLIEAGNSKQEVITSTQEVDTRFEVSFLTPLREYEKKNGAVTDFSSALVNSTMNQYPDLEKFPIYAPDRWNYEYSFFMAGVYRQGKKVKSDSYVLYAQQWVDGFITNEGSFEPGVYNMKEYKLDDILPGRVVIYLHEETKNPKYKAIADTLILHLAQQPKTSDGGYWHKEIYPYQMWLDGIFMADVFSMQYAKAYNQPEWFDESIHQIKLIYQRTLDPTTGLLYHGWDESKNPVWAHPERGTSPEFWGRAVGWYLMALVESLDYIPENHPERDEVIKILQDLSAVVRKYQDSSSKLWYQVMDKGNQPGNWIETSCSAMFAYAFAKGHRQGFLDESYLVTANEAFNALLDQYVFVDDAGNLHLDQTVKIGTLNPKNSKGDFEYYISTERRIDDYKGLASLLFLSIELNK